MYYFFLHLQKAETFCTWHECDPITAKDNWSLLSWSCPQPPPRQAVSLSALQKALPFYGASTRPFCSTSSQVPAFWRQPGQLSAGTPTSARKSRADSQQWIPRIQTNKGHNFTSVFEECCHQITTPRTILNLLKFLSQCLNVTARWSNKWWIIYFTFPRLGLPSVIYTSHAGFCFGFIPVVSVSPERVRTTINNNH